MDDTPEDDTAEDDTAALFRDHGLTFDAEPDARTRVLDAVEAGGSGDVEDSDGNAEESGGHIADPGGHIENPGRHVEDHSRHVEDHSRHVEDPGGHVEDPGGHVVDPFEDDDIAEYQPRQRVRLPWLTLLLIALIIWGAGFLVGVLVDRAISGALG